MALDLTTSEFAGYILKYFDITSLYPYVNYTGNFPISKPEIKVLNKKVRWTSSADNPFKGLLKVVVVPPQNLLVPPLPMKMPNRLLFSLCATCAKKYEKKCTLVENYACNHSEEQREFLTTATHNELNASLDRGYVGRSIFVSQCKLSF